MSLHRLIQMFFLPLTVSFVNCSLQFDRTNMNMLRNERAKLNLSATHPEAYRNKTIILYIDHEEILQIEPKHVQFFDTKSVSIEILAKSNGESQIYTNFSTSSTEDAFVTIQVYKSEFIEILSMIMGWGYFFAWSCSFYPQIYENHKRKSVVGLNFDFLAINLTGYLCYAAFNLGLYYIPSIKEQYSERYPRSVVSVFFNDIFFSVHAIILTVYTCLQCLWYDRGNQKISWFGYAFHYISGIILVISMGLSILNYILWLDFLYICSYIKLSVTVCKYAPQALMNYRRQSTEGWSIWNVLWDLAGGILSILQMFLNAYNYDKWIWIFENPTKLGLGILTLVFDFIFMAQHYWLYKEDRLLRNKNMKNVEIDLVEAMLEKDKLPN